MTYSNCYTSKSNSLEIDYKNSMSQKVRERVTYSTCYTSKSNSLEIGPIIKVVQRTTRDSDQRANTYIGRTEKRTDKESCPGSGSKKKYVENSIIVVF